MWRVSGNWERTEKVLTASVIRCIGKGKVVRAGKRGLGTPSLNPNLVRDQKGPRKPNTYHYCMMLGVPNLDFQPILM